ncbi:MAG: Acg family FMN-binding oxidoreductase [Streptosporangiaceae bacterium]
MTRTTRHNAAPTLTAQSGYLIGVASRAPSVHNTQPWRFRVGEDAIELYADTARQLTVDPDGREMLISCGAALFGLRLAVRSLGCLAEVDLLPGGSVLARVRPGLPSAMTAEERSMLKAMLRRHTHRGPFEPVPLPAGLLAGLQDDARAEGTELVVVDSAAGRRELAVITRVAGRRQDSDSRSRAEVYRWSHDAASPARDGVPAHAFPATPSRRPGQLPQRDFDLGRGFGLITAGGPAAPVTAVLATSGDGPRDWLQAGQALHRLLLHAASQWVFASLNSQPLEEPGARSVIGGFLTQPASPQMLLELGVSRVTHATARRPPAGLTRTTEPRSGT